MSTENVIPLNATPSAPISNTSGLIPVGRAVLVKPYESKEKVTESGLIIETAKSTRERMQLEDKCIVIAIGDTAWEDESKPRAQVGDHVMVTRHAGYWAKGPSDNVDYRLINDRDIFAKITHREE